MSYFKAIAVLFVATLSCGSQYSNASLIWNFGFGSDDNGFRGTGSFELLKESKSATEDGSVGFLKSFQYSGTCDYIACSFGLGDVDLGTGIYSSYWSLDPLTGMFTDLYLSAYSGSESIPPGEPWVYVEEDRLTSELSCIFCPTQAYSFREELFSDGDFYAFLQPVPVPATLGLLGLGLAGLGLFRRKARRHS